MKKLFKKITVSLLAAVTIFGLLSANAFAAGRVSGIRYGSGSSTYVDYFFDVDGNYYSRTNNGAHYGQTSTTGFSVSSSGTYSISFGGIPTGATVYIYNEKTNAQICGITIPVYQSGMPTLYYSANLDAGQYYVKVVSASYETYSIGSFRVNGVSGTYTHTI